MKVKSLRRVRLFATPWIVAYQASPSMGFSRQKYWSGLPFPPPGDFPDPGIKLTFPASPAGGFFTAEPPGRNLRIRCFSEMGVPRSGVHVGGSRKGMEQVATLPYSSPTAGLPGIHQLCVPSAGSTSSSLSDHWLLRLGSSNGSTRGSLLSWSSAPGPARLRLPESAFCTNSLPRQEKGMFHHVG